MVSGNEVSPALLAGCMINTLWQLDGVLFQQKQEIMDAYRKHCITLGKQVQVIRADTVRAGTALSMDDDGALLVQYADGSRESVNSGEVSIRGMYGYL